MSEQTQQTLTLIALQRAYPSSIWDRRNVGRAIDPRTGALIRFGRKGQSDIWGVVSGRHIEIEMKSATGRQTKDQRNWQHAVERAGGIYILARKPDDALAVLEEHFGSI